MDDETKLIRASQHCDLQAYDKLMEVYLPQVRAHISMRVPVRHIIDDLIQETFIFAYQHIDEFTAGTSFRSWLYAIAGNMIRKTVQKYSREQVNKERYALFSTIIQQSNDEGKEDELDALKQCLDRVPQKQRELLDLKYQQQVKGNRIARMLRRSEEWVYQNLHRIRSTIRKCMDQRLQRGRLA